MTLLRGYDISAYQGTTAPTGDFVIVKATEGKSYSSSKFAAQWASAKTKAKVRGAYHFARPEQSSGSSQADRLIARAGAVPGELLVLDLEASDLNQAQTNAWAKAFGDRLREKAPGVTTVVYMGSGYASNGTGKGLADHFDYWWYPVYPSAFSAIRRVLARTVHHAIRLAAPARSRGLILSKVTHSWPSVFSPWLPSGITTGWKKPHIWQFTDNFGGLDANISTLTLAQLAGGSRPAPTPPPAPKPKAWPGRYLVYTARLMHGADVTWVQERLNVHGAKPPVKVDGEYGKLTAAAVRRFQTLKHIGIDGIVGKLTWNALAK